MCSYFSSDVFFVLIIINILLKQLVYIFPAKIYELSYPDTKDFNDFSSIPFSAVSVPEYYNYFIEFPIKLSISIYILGLYFL